MKSGMAPSIAVRRGGPPSTSWGLMALDFHWPSLNTDLVIFPE